jgi:hypothetical protein
MANLTVLSSTSALASTASTHQLVFSIVHQPKMGHLQRFTVMLSIAAVIMASLSTEATQSAGVVDGFMLQTLAMQFQHSKKEISSHLV